MKTSTDFPPPITETRRQIMLTAKQQHAKASIEDRSKVDVVIDFGNGEINAALRKCNSTVWNKISFKSYVADVSKGEFNSFEIKNHGSYVVGEEAMMHVYRHIGQTESGKVEDALKVLLQAVRMQYGTQNLTLNVAFTSPSTKSYGKLIQDSLKGNYTLFNSEGENQQIITIGQTTPLLEGHLAVLNLKEKAEGKNVLLLDVGNRTMIASIVSPAGRIYSRRVFDRAGVKYLADSLIAEEALHGFKGMSLIPDTEDVINYLFESHNASTQKKIAKAVSPCFETLIQQFTTWCSEESQASKLKTCKAFVIGGGANIPGVAEALDAEIVEDAQWANVNAICKNFKTYTQKG